MINIISLEVPPIFFIISAADNSPEMCALVFFIVNSLHLGKNFPLFCRLLIFFKINFFQKYFKEYHLIV